MLRAPGIYAPDRLPLPRLRTRAPLLRTEDDVYTGHIHADDLARALLRALEPDAPEGTYNAADDTEMLMGDWMDFVADRSGLPRLPRLPRARISDPSGVMMESRRLDNRKLKQKLGLRLTYPTVQEGLQHVRALGVH